MELRFDLCGYKYATKAFKIFNRRLKGCIQILINCGTSLQERLQTDYKNGGHLWTYREAKKRVKETER